MHAGINSIIYEIYKKSNLKNFITKLICSTFYKKCDRLLESGVVIFLAKIRMNIHAI
jgi:hypothetical protein